MTRKIKILNSTIENYLTNLINSTRGSLQGRMCVKDDCVPLWDRWRSSTRGGITSQETADILLLLDSWFSRPSSKSELTLSIGVKNLTRQVGQSIGQRLRIEVLENIDVRRRAMDTGRLWSEEETIKVLPRTGRPRRLPTSQSGAHDEWVGVARVTILRTVVFHPQAVVNWRARSCFAED